MTRERPLTQAVTLSDEATAGPETELYKARVTYHDALQMLKLLDAERAGAGFTDGLPPPLCPLG